MIMSELEGRADLPLSDSRCARNPIPMSVHREDARDISFDESRGIISRAIRAAGRAKREVRLAIDLM